MPTAATKKLVDQLHVAGLSLSVTKDGGLSVKPSARLNDDLRGLLRNNKAALIDWLTTDKELTMTPEAQIVEYRLYTKLQPPPQTPEATQAVEPLSNPEDWRELDAAYLAHHFHCKTCTAAGRGIRYGLRCGAGAALWRTYSDAAMQPVSNTNGQTT